MDKAVFSIFKDEAPYIREWVVFHYLQGFKKFYLYNNESSDSWQKEIQDFIDLGYVEITDWPGTAQQLPAYEDYIVKNKERKDCPRWTAFIDIDEFIYSRSGKTVAEVLDKNTDQDCVTASWLMFGFGGHQRKPSGLVIENFTKRGDISVRADHVKSIVDIKKVLKFYDPHKFEIEGKTKEIQDLKINHYWTKSQEEWAEKWSRGRSDTGTQHNLRNSLEEIKNFSEEEDNTIKELWLTEVKSFMLEKNE
jgi:hypothetical protein